MHSDAYIHHAWAIDGMDWATPHPYVIGVRVFWRGVRLVCTMDHYAGDAAEHPWDPAWGWRHQHAAMLWTPDGPEQADKLEGMDDVPPAGRCAALGEVEPFDQRQDSQAHVACIRSGGHYWSNPEFNPDIDDAAVCRRCGYRVRS